MANAAKKAGAANTIVQADVSKNGTVKLNGTIPKMLRAQLLRLIWKTIKVARHHT